MSEHLRAAGPETAEKLDLTEISRQNLEKVRAEAEKLEAKGEHKSVEQIQHQVEQAAISGKEYSVGDHDAAPASHSFGTHQQLKYDSYRKTLSHVRSKLTKSEKALSKYIHTKHAERMDELVTRTIARPWGLFGGGLTAFVGSLVVLVFANYLGFRYNFTVFAVLFVFGYLGASILEMVGKLVKR
jgi:hypothetical protein